MSSITLPATSLSLPFSICKMWLLVQLHHSVMLTMNHWGVQWPLFLFLSWSRIFMQHPQLWGLRTRHSPRSIGEHALPKYRLSFGISLASSKIAHDILPLPGETPRISFAMNARDVPIFIFYRPRCVERRSRLTASLAWAFKVNYSLVQEGIDGVRQPFGQRERGATAGCCSEPLTEMDR